MDNIWIIYGWKSLWWLYMVNRGTGEYHGYICIWLYMVKWYGDTFGMKGRRNEGPERNLRMKQIHGSKRFESYDSFHTFWDWNGVWQPGLWMVVDHGFHQDLRTQPQTNIFKSLRLLLHIFVTQLLSISNHSYHERTIINLIDVCIWIIRGGTSPISMVHVPLPCFITLCIWFGFISDW